MVVSGLGLYDEYGRIDSVSLPVTQALGTDSIFDVFAPSHFASTVYDTLDRPVVQIAPDNTQVSYQYGFGTDAFGKISFSTTATDPNNKVATSYSDARGLKTSTTAPLTTITKLYYDPLGRLIQSTDPDANSTYYNYDMLGRLTSRIHPDAGTTSYTYDLAGNVLTTQTQILSGSSQYIQYNYADARLSSIVYPQNPEMNVYYEYGAPNTGNQSSRLIRQQDASGVQTFEYGNMGELIKNIHTFVVPAGNAYTYETDWVYDSWNRVNQITYPDGEVATYSYNNGGQLISLTGIKGSESFAYIDDIEYNLFGARTFIDYGNETFAEYVYNPVNQRLSNLTSYESTGRIMQSVDYSYDDASNIEAISNNSDWVGINQGLGGDYSYTYEYDELYRLTVANGSFDSKNNSTLGNSLSMTYSESGNILSKEVYADVETGGSVNTLSYSNSYSYDDRPHNVTSAGCYSYDWDYNGNLVHRSDGCNSSERYLCWDEENRLTTVRNFADKFSNLSSYIYNAGSERTWKLAGDVYEMLINGDEYVEGVDYEKTLYASPYLVVDDAEYTKHYYIEGERVCTKIGGHFMLAPTPPNGTPLDFISCNIDEFQRSLRDMVDRGIECTQFNPEYVNISPTLNVMHRKAILPETNLYFYHPDHLGSSSFITDATGYAVQHLQYLPFGETFVDQQNGYDSRYTFSAKEKDDETQYSYFGARYYDSDLSVWLSVDPLADKYPSMSPYMYVAGNPIKLVDPDGNRIILHGKNQDKKAYSSLLNNNTTNTRASVGLFGTLKIKVVDPTKELSMFDQVLLESYNNKNNKVKMNLQTISSSYNDHFYIGYKDPRPDYSCSILASINGLTMANNEDPSLFKMLTQDVIDLVDLKLSGSQRNERTATIYNEDQNTNYSSLQISEDRKTMRDDKYPINIYDESEFYNGRDAKDIIKSYEVTIDQLSLVGVDSK